MKSRTLLILSAVSCIGLLSFALYLQHFKDMQPCPLCVLQRYAYLVIAIASLIGAISNKPKLGAGLGLIGGLAGAGTAGYHLWVQAHPAVSCGRDPLEAALNQLFTAQWLPSMFKADGMCTSAYDPILGLSIVQWSMAWFTGLTLVLIFIAFRRRT